MMERPEVDAFLERTIATPLLRTAVRHAMEQAIAVGTSSLESKRFDVLRVRALGCAHPHAFSLWHTWDGSRMRVCPTCARVVFDNCPKQL